MDRDTLKSMAIGLGWFSVALGAAEIFAPRAVARATGLEGRARLLRLYGLREVAAGVGLLMGGRVGPWLWARVAGDALDAATLGAAARSPRARARAAASFVAVAGVTALDVYGAVKASS